VNPFVTSGKLSFGIARVRGCIRGLDIDYEYDFGSNTYLKLRGCFKRLDQSKKYMFSGLTAGFFGQISDKIEVVRLVQSSKLDF
jgi:hypothetical protein